MNLREDSKLRNLLINRARIYIGVSTYCKGATLEEAPQVFNCFRFTQWLWRSVGVSLPDHQLLWPDAVFVLLDQIDAADLVFVPRLNYKAEEDDFGHVGIATGANTIIHATKWKNGVVEEPLSLFVARGCLGVRRVPQQHYCRS